MVLDINAEEATLHSSQSPPVRFTGAIGATSAIEMDAFLWPKHTQDIARLFPTQVRYAQNGKFAVMVQLQWVRPGTAR